MHRLHILTFPHLGRMPKLMVALGLFALVIAAGGAKAAPAKAAVTGTTEITFDSITFDRLDDGIQAPGLTDARADVYGVFGIRVKENSGRRKELGIATWNNAAGCSNATPYGPWHLYQTWSAMDSKCTKEVFEGTAYGFGDAPLCTTDIASHACVSGYGYGNNKLRMVMTSGETLIPYVRLYDYDSASGNDLICAVELPIPFSDASFVHGATGYYGMAKGFNGYGSCTVSFHLRTL
jgi:hypothetical protein